MWTNGVTDRFRATLVKSHTVVSKLEILKDNAVVTTIQGKTIVDSSGNFAYSLDGTVRVSRAAIRRTLDGLDILDPAAVLVVDEVTDLLSPLQTEVRVYRGVRYFDATPAECLSGAAFEYVPVGTFGITSVNSRNKIISLRGDDRMARVTKARFTAPWAVKAGNNLGAELRRILLAALPPALADIDIPDTPETTPTLLYSPQDYMGDKAYEMALAAGWVLYVDPLGTFRVRTNPTPDPALMVANYEAGAGSRLLDHENELDATSVINAVQATGQSGTSTTAIPTGYAEDDDPTSLTYTQRIGTFVDFLDSPLFLTNDMASAGARTHLKNVGGIADKTLVTSLCDPTLDVDDVIRVVDPNTSRVRYLIADDFTVGMRAAANMPINCRTVSTVL